jgi:hypothetical protein
MIHEDDCGAIGGMKIDRETEVLGENLPQRHFVHHKSHMTRHGLEPLAAAVGSRRLTAWAVARPPRRVLHTYVIRNLAGYTVSKWLLHRGLHTIVKIIIYWNDCKSFKLEFWLKSIERQCSFTFELRFWGPPNLLSNWLTGLKSPGREADHSPAPSAEVKNGRAIPPLPYTPSWHTA